MSIILAIEPDRRRAAQLTGMARMHLKAELLIAANASEAVDALNGRVPDVLLTAPLLPSQEEAAIGDYLRELGAAAAHVQTLTIPLLASSGSDRDRPVLSAFRRNRPQRTEAEGCDPAVFAEQISEYLREARERLAAPTLVNVAAATPDITAAPVDVAAPFVEDSSDPVPFSRSLTKRETVSQLLAKLFPAADEAEAVETVPAVHASPEPLFAPAHEMGAPEPVDAFPSPERGLTTLPAPVASAPEPIAFPADFDLPEPANFDPTPIGAPVVIAAAQQKRNEDEWRFFDPSQCGFPALIAKLDEIAARDGEN
jgi:hypothetical protein